MLILYLQFIDDPSLMNDEKLKPIKLPLSHLSGLTTSATCEQKLPLAVTLIAQHPFVL